MELAEKKLKWEEPICYSGCNLFHKDYNSLEPYQWLRSEIINLLAVIMIEDYEKHTPKGSPKVKLIDPFVSTMLIFCGDQETLLELKSQKFFEYDYLFFALNTETDSESKGSHWYLLVFDVKRKKLFGYDSAFDYCINQNKGHSTTQKIKEKLEEMM